MGRGRGGRFKFFSRNKDTAVQTTRSDAATELKTKEAKPSPLAEKVRTGVIQPATIEVDWIAPWAEVTSSNKRVPSSREEAISDLLDDLRKDPKEIFSNWNLAETTSVIIQDENGEEQIIQSASPYDSFYGRERNFRIVARARVQADTGWKNLDLSEEPEETNWNAINDYSKDLISLDSAEFEFFVQEIERKGEQYIDMITNEPIEDRIWNLSADKALEVLCERLEADLVGTYQQADEIDSEQLAEISKSLEEKFPDKKVVLTQSDTGIDGNYLRFELK